MFKFSSSDKLESTPFSEFFRSAPSSEKKRVYQEVLKTATEAQQKVVGLHAGSKAK